jgi:hypothetical protein
MNLKRIITYLLIATFALNACRKDAERTFTYYEVGFQSNSPDWRDTLIVVRTANPELIAAADAQLNIPVADRKIVFGNLVAGSGGYNKNNSHQFKWHFNDDWQLVDLTAEIYDGRAYSDIDLDINYWLNTVKRYGAWSSYIKRKLPGKP